MTTPIELHALQDDWTLNADADTDRSTGSVFYFSYNLTDPSGNKLKDPLGNYLVGLQSSTMYPQFLHALPDDFSLNAEATNG